MFQEEDFLQLSGIQHFEFCRRQWALAYIEMQWQENVRTVEGKILHEKAHDAEMKEKRGDLLVVRALPIHSREMGVSGECDVVEFHKVNDGIRLAGKEGSYQAIPVEYKRGKPKQMILIFFSWRRRRCVWRKCYVARYPMDIFFTVR